MDRLLRSSGFQKFFTLRCMFRMRLSRGHALCPESGAWASRLDMARLGVSWSPDKSDKSSFCWHWWSGWSAAAWRFYLKMVERERLWYDGEEPGRVKMVGNYRRWSSCRDLAFKVVLKAVYARMSAIKQSYPAPRPVRPVCPCVH